MKRGLYFFLLICPALAFAWSCTKATGEQDNTGTPEPPQGRNLAEGDAYANCYIVTEAGDYYFAARTVDGKPLNDAVSADWIWSTDDIDPEGLVYNVGYSDGFISFSVRSGKGNAVIGVFDSNGNVLWSWHIWMTEMPGHQEMDNGAVFMDRNLGAMSALPEDVSKTYGLKYQWGRKDPFYGGDVNEEDGSVFSEAMKSTVFNSRLGMEWKAVKRDGSCGTVGYTVANPTVFIYYDKGEDGCDWLAERNDFLWSDGQTGAKTNYDPCPAGYRVAYDGAWEGCGYWNVEDDPDKGGRYMVSESGEKFWWPLCGTRWGDSDAGKLGYVGVNGVGVIWMRTTVNCGYNASCFYYHQGTYVANSYAMYRSYGEAVRCTYEPGS